MGARFFAPAQNGPEAHPDSCTVDMGSLSLGVIDHFPSRPSWTFDRLSCAFISLNILANPTNIKLLKTDNH